MKHIIRLQQSNTEFEAREGSTILESALSKNIHMDHSCKSGDCNTCKVVLLSGAVQLENGQIIESGEFLTCNSVPLSSIEIDAKYYPELSEISRKTVPLKINRAKRLSQNVIQLLFRSPPTARLDYLPGQYIDLIYRGVTRSYSIANAPENNNELELHIKRVENGEMSSLLFSDLKENTLMRAFGPNGTFFVRESEAPIAFLVTGTGFAPAKAMIEDLLFHKNTNRDIYLFWGARRECDFYSEEPKKWEEEYQNFNYVPVLSKPDVGWLGETGYVQSVFIASVEALFDFHVYACGSPEMINSAKTQLIENGLTKENFYSDAFVATTN